MISEVLRAWYRDIQRTSNLKWLIPFMVDGRKLSDEFVDSIHFAEIACGDDLTSRENIVKVINLALKSRNDKIKEYVE